MHRPKYWPVRLRIRPSAFVVGALACSLLLFGCATTGKLQAPRVTVIAANMTSADIFSQMFRVRLRVDNPNARALPIKSLDYKLFLEGDSFAEGQSPAPFVVPANGTSEFELPVRTNFVSSIGRLLSRLSGTDRTQIEYAVSGTVTVDMPFSPKIKFNEGGVVDFAKR